MADRTTIEWTDATWNPIVGCSLLSPGCTNCYAMRLAGTRLRHHPSRAGLTQPSKAGPVWTGETRLDEKALVQPLRWRRPRKIFVCAHSDLFHPATPDEWIDRVFAVMALCPQHTFQVLTKRPERMREYLTALGRDACGLLNPLACLRLKRAAEHVVRNDARTSYDWARGWPLPHVWIGVTAERQQEAEERIPILLATPAAKRFVSVEPMLGAVDLEAWLDPEETCDGCDDSSMGFAGHCKRDDIPRNEQCPWKRAVQVITEHGPFADDGAPFNVTSEVITLDWVICGGESGPNARPMHPDWARSLRDQCAAAGVPFLLKQWGEWGVVQRDVRDATRGVRALIDVTFDTDWMSWDPRTDTMMQTVGKSRAGRLLDGVTHDAFPEG